MFPKQRFFKIYFSRSERAKDYEASSVKWGHLVHLEPNSINTIFSTKILWGYLAHFEPDSVTTIKQKQNKN